MKYVCCITNSSGVHCVFRTGGAGASLFQHKAGPLHEHLPLGNVHSHTKRELFLIWSSSFSLWPSMLGPRPLLAPVHRIHFSHRYGVERERLVSQMPKYLFSNKPAIKSLHRPLRTLSLPEVDNWIAGFLDVQHFLYVMPLIVYPLKWFLLYRYFISCLVPLFMALFCLESVPFFYSHG